MKKYLLYLMSLLALNSCQEVEQIPLIANFESDVLSVEMGQTVRFKDLSSGNPTRWNWVFEGGNPEESVLFSPEVCYNTPGVYTVSLKVQKPDMISEVTKEKMITVTYPSDVNVDFIADKTSATNAEVVKFTDMTKGFPTKWSWTFTSDKGVVVTSDQQNPELVFTTPGIYSVKLVAENPEGTGEKSRIDYLTIIDKDAVSAEFTVDSRDTYAGGKIRFFDATVGNQPDSWEWVFEGGSPSSSVDANPVVEYSVPGQYKVSLKVCKGVNTSVIEKVAYVNVIPSDGLVFFYPFDGDSKDVGPYSLDASFLSEGDANVTFDAAAHYAEALCEGRTSASFSGGNLTSFSVLRVPDEGLKQHYDPAGDFTVSCWVKVDKMPSGKKYAIYHQGSGPGMNPAGTRQAWLRITTDKKHVVSCVEYKGKSGNWAEYSGATRYDDGQWHHYACVYKKNGNVRDSYLYLDGAVIASSKGKPDKIIDAVPFYIGCNYRMSSGVFSPENFMNGCIDDFVLYNRALSEEEVIGLYERK